LQGHSDTLLDFQTVHDPYTPEKEVVEVRGTPQTAHDPYAPEKEVVEVRGTPQTNYDPNAPKKGSC
jgi:hypothetical protein